MYVFPPILYSPRSIPDDVSKLLSLHVYPKTLLSLDPRPHLTSSHRVVYTLLIINKAGGLIYNRTFNESLSRLSTNDYLVLAGTFHGVHAITRSLTPSAITSDLASGLSTPPPPPSKSTASNPPPPSHSTDPSAPSTAAAVRAQLSGIEVLETGLFRLTCFQTVSGMKFLLFTEPTQPNVEAILRRVYELYADYVMKNPFYQLEMPIRAENFDRHLTAFLRAK